jgi:hypothetical protein
MVTIHSRTDWGFTGWAKDSTGKRIVPAGVPDSSRTEFYTHYEGGVPTRDTGAAAMRSIDAGHRANGWAGIGYNFVVTQDGSIWEGRGWGLVGAHCPNHNRSGWGVQVHIGGDQVPSMAALRSQRALYDEACRRAGHSLAKKGHRDGYATECPGVPLYAWVRAGMPVPTAPTPTPTQEDDDMAVTVLQAKDTGRVYERIETVKGPQAAYVTAPETRTVDVRAGATVVEYDHEVDLLAEFPRSAGNVIG